MEYIYILYIYTEKHALLDCIMLAFPNFQVLNVRPDHIYLVCLTDYINIFIYIYRTT